MAALTSVQLAILKGCVMHERGSFSAITGQSWWMAPEPFRGERAAFAAHLRTLERGGYLRRHLAFDGRCRGYLLTDQGRKAAAEPPAR